MSVPSDESFDYVVLGAGIAGLAFAYEMQKAGRSVLVLEKEDRIGGLSKTLDHKGFLLDYSAHRFHSANPCVMKHVQELMKPNFIRHAQRSRIFMFGRYLKYPFELQNLLRAMPTTDAAMSAINFASNMIIRRFRRQRGSQNYRSWFVHHFGERLYRVMCEPYTSKIWKQNPSLLSADWADQRFQGVNLGKLIQRILSKVARLDFSSYSLDDETLAPDGGEFYYPRRGIQQIADRYAEYLAAKKTPIITGARVDQVRTENKTVSYTKNSQQHQIRYREAVISTIPLHGLYHALGEKNASVESDLGGIKYMNIIFVYLFLRKKRVSYDHWLYFPDSEIIFNRSVEFKNWSEDMAPVDKTALCLDITCFESDLEWIKPDDELVRQCISGAAKVGLLSESEVDDALVVRVPYAYPFYDLDYQRKLVNVVRHCEKSGEVYCLGRTGIFKYNNADGSIEMALALADRLLKPNEYSEKSLLGYNFKYVSY